jgi:hypothetical protein
MNSKQFQVLLALAVLFSLASCSGTHNRCTTNCGGGGTASLSLTLAAIPFVPPPKTSILSFVVTINSVSLTPSSGGSVVDIPLNAATYTVDLTRLQSDSSFLGQVISNVPAGTYNKVTVGVTSAVVTYCTTTSGIPGCNSGSVAQFTAGAAAPATSSFSLTLAAAQKAGLQVIFNIGNAVTVNPTTQVVSAVNLAAANVVTAVPLPPSASTLSTGQFDYIEDVTGVVTAATSTSVTVQTSTHGPITSVITSSTIGSPNCVITNVVCSPAVGQIASVDATLNSDGTSTMLEYDPLSPTSVDVIEGIVTTVPSSSTQFQIVTNDLILATSNSKIGSNISLGEPVLVTYTGANPFVIDTKGLPFTTTPFQRQHIHDRHFAWPNGSIAYNRFHCKERSYPGGRDRGFRSPSLYPSGSVCIFIVPTNFWHPKPAAVFWTNRDEPGAVGLHKSDYLSRWLFHGQQYHGRRQCGSAYSIFRRGSDTVVHRRKGSQALDFTRLRKGNGPRMFRGPYFFGVRRQTAAFEIVCASTK